MDTFDLKPNAPAEFRGEFNPIKTNVAGVEICEHLPKLAQCADKFAILRGVSHTLAAHELGQEYVNTGNRPLPSLTVPRLRCRGQQGAARPRPTCRRSWPFPTRPASRLPGREVRSAEHAAARPAPASRSASAASRWAAADGRRRREAPEPAGRARPHLPGLRGERANWSTASIASPSRPTTSSPRTRSREAFDISKESPAFAKPFGEDGFGAELPAGHAAGRVGRAVRHLSARRLGHAHTTTSPG